MGDRGVEVGGGIFAWLVGLGEGEVIDLDLSLSCIVCFVLLCLEETAATAAESAEIAISLTVSAATSAFCVPETETILGDASTALTGATS